MLSDGMENPVNAPAFSGLSSWGRRREAKISPNPTPPEAGLAEFWRALAALERR